MIQDYLYDIHNSTAVLVHHFIGCGNRSDWQCKVSPCSRPHRHRVGVEVQLYSFNTSELEGGGWSTSRPGRLYPRERPGAHCTGG